MSTSGKAELNDAVRRLLEGDEGGFREAYRAIHPGLVRYLTVLVGVVDADDVASETWSQVVRDLGRFTGDADGFRGWVTTIGRHRALDHLRRRQRRPEDIGLPEGFDLDAPDDVGAQAEGLVGTARALALIRSLPRDQAEAIMLRVVMGLDAKAAAAVLEKRPGAVRSAAHRGLQTLRRRLEEDAGEKFAQERDTSPPSDAEGVS